jgi:phage terminase large subunit-like protein
MLGQSRKTLIEGGSLARGVRKAECEDPLVFDSSATGTQRFKEWCAKYLLVPKGAGAGEPMIIHPFQETMVRGVLETDCRNSLVIAPRGMSKSTTMAALALYLIFDQRLEGAILPLIGQTESASDRLMKVVKRMVQIAPELDKRCVIHHDRIYVPESNSEIIAVAPTLGAIEGGDYAPVALIDEIGFIETEVFQSILLSTGKRAGSGLLAIGTPPTPTWAERSPLLDWWASCQHDEDPDTYLAEFLGDHCSEPKCLQCLKKAYSGALGTVIQLDDLIATMPPKVTEAEWQRARLCRYVAHTAESFLTPELWNPLADNQVPAPGSKIIISLDGSYNGDATAVMVGTVSPKPHLFVGGLWERPADATDAWTVPVLEVEDRIRELAAKFKVVEIVADPFRWERTLQVLASEGHSVSRFPWSTSRAGTASSGFRTAVLAGELSHSGDPDLTRHVLNAIYSDKGVPSKPSKRSARRIDLLAASIMAHSRATWHGRKRGRVASFSSKKRTR